MDISHIGTLSQIASFLQTHFKSSLSPSKSKQEIYDWLRTFLSQIKYHKLKKKEKRLVRRFIIRVIDYSNIQIKRLISKHKEGKLFWKKWQKGDGRRKYTQEDIALLHLVDKAHLLSGEATRHVLYREYEVFDKQEFRRLAGISASHIYNLRHRVSYQRMGKIFTKTKPHVINIGEKRKPDPKGKPGYLRVDSVHQGDRNKKKGVYYINIVDEVTQWELVFCVEGISERYLKPILELIIKFFPYKVINFHSDNGSEYINKMTADILNRLHVGQTKSRSRKSNDNALVEGKNGSIVRKHFGYMHIPATTFNSHLLNVFCINYLNPYLNYHRPCGFATTIVDKRGKEKKKYDTYLTPYEKLKSLDRSNQYLKEGITFNELDKIAQTMSDTEYAQLMNKKKTEAFRQLRL